MIDFSDFGTVWSMCEEYLGYHELFALDIHCEICGNTVESINDCIYVMFGYHSFEQFYESELKNA